MFWHSPYITCSIVTKDTKPPAHGILRAANENVQIKQVWKTPEKKIKGNLAQILVIFF